MLKGFKAFLMRGNLLDLAVAVVIGAAFGAVVKALVTDVLMPIIAAIAGKPDFANLSFTINGSKFMYGDFFNAVVAFVLVAAATRCAFWTSDLTDSSTASGTGAATDHAAAAPIV